MSICQNDWKFSLRVPADRQAKLNNSPKFDDIIASIVTNSAITNFCVVAGETCAVRGARRPEFKVEVYDKDLVDLFFNSREGYRAQYWISPDNGLKQNKKIIRDLMCKLLSAVNVDRQNRMTRDEVLISLQRDSSKIWILEDEKVHWCPNALHVARWNNARDEGIPNAGRGSAIAVCSTLEVKGAFLKEGTNKERVQSDKLTRSEDIFNYGYS